MVLYSAADCIERFLYYRAVYPYFHADYRRIVGKPYLEADFRVGQDILSLRDQIAGVASVGLRADAVAGMWRGLDLVCCGSNVDAFRYHGQYVGRAARYFSRIFGASGGSDLFVFHRNNALRDLDCPMARRPLRKTRDRRQFRKDPSNGYPIQNHSLSIKDSE